MKNLKFILTVLFVGVAVTGCVNTPPDHYHWGHYEKLLLDMYNKPGAADSTLQIQQLNDDILTAESLGKPVAPGIYAHLGLMYAMQGQMAESLAAFDEEKARFPESIPFIDGMLKRLETEKERQNVSG